jgi:hypothetical protein
MLILPRPDRLALSGTDHHPAALATTKHNAFRLVTGMPVDNQAPEHLIQYRFRLMIEIAAPGYEVRDDGTAKAARVR